MTKELVESRIPSNLRTLLILEVIGRSDRAMTATEINDEIGLPKQTVHRLVSTLEKEGFLNREPGGKRYRPSRRLRLMGAWAFTCIAISHNSSSSSSDCSISSARGSELCCPRRNWDELSG